MVHCTVYSVQYKLLCTLYSALYCTWNTAQRTLYTVQQGSPTYRGPNMALFKKMMALLTFMRIKKVIKKICNEKDLNMFGFLAKLP